MDYIFYDVIIAAALFFFLWRGYVKGFVLTLCGLLAVFVALIGASVLSSLLAGPVAQAVVPMLERCLTQAVGSALQAAPSVSGSVPGSWINDLPLEEVLAALQDSPLFRTLADSFRTAVEQGTAQVVSGVIRALAEYVAAQLAHTVLFLLLFVAVLLVWKLLSRILDLAFHLPVLFTLNHWAGAAVGLLKGALLVFIAAWLLKDSLIPPQAVEQTWLLKFFCTETPLSLFL